MARISTYPIDTDVVGTDILVGTDFSSGRARATKNFTVESLSDYIKDKVSVTGQMKFRYVTQPLLGEGTFSLEGGGPVQQPFSTITKIIVSNIDRTPQEVVAFLEYLVNSDILIANQSDISLFGHYKVTAYAVNATNINFYDLTINYLGGNGSLVTNGLYNIINFVKAGDIGDKNATFTQAAPITVWNITHNLGKFPSVSIVDDAEEQVQAQVDYIDNNSLTVTFTAPFSGKAYLN